MLRYRFSICLVITFECDEQAFIKGQRHYYVEKRVKSHPSL